MLPTAPSASRNAAIPSAAAAPFRILRRSMDTSSARHSSLNGTVDGLTAALEKLLGLALIAAVAFNFVNVVGRYIFGTTFLSADEVQIYIMVYIAFLGAAVATWRRAHLRMDVLVLRLPRAAKATLAALALAPVLLC